MFLKRLLSPNPLLEFSFEFHPAFPSHFCSFSRSPVTSSRAYSKASLYSPSLTSQLHLPLPITLFCEQPSSAGRSFQGYTTFWHRSSELSSSTVNRSQVLRAFILVTASYASFNPLKAGIPLGSLTGNSPPHGCLTRECSKIWSCSQARFLSICGAQCHMKIQVPCLQSTEKFQDNDSRVLTECRALLSTKPSATAEVACTGN